jgi:hypothetical protein
MSADRQQASRLVPESPVPASGPGGFGVIPPTSAIGRGRARLFGGLVIALAVLVHAPAITAPFLFDDYFQSSMLDGRYPSTHDQSSPFDLFDFIDDGNRAPLVERGMLPWWSDPHMVLHFLRPVSSALVWVDHRISDKSAVWPHVHSLLWWALSSLAVYALLAQSFSRRVAWIGAACFAFSPAHAIPLVWLANRSALVAIAFGTAGLVAYARWRETRRPRAGLVAFALFSLAVGAGEYALCFTGYVAAIEIFKRRESLSRRAMGLVPFAVPVVAYLAVHAGGHFGAHGSGFYRDPFDDFQQFAMALPRGFVVLACTAWLGVDAVWWGIAPGWAACILALAGVGLISAPVVWTLRSLDRVERERASWLLLGSFLALGPVLAVALSARGLGAATIGVSAIVALVVDRAWFAAEPLGRTRTTGLFKAASFVLAFVHLARGPLDSWVSIRETALASRDNNERIGWVRTRAEGSREVVLLRAEHPSSILFAPVMLEGVGPATVRTLSYTRGPVLILRPTSRSLELVSNDSTLFSIGPSDLFRSFPIEGGSVVDLVGMRATVEKVSDDGRPHRIRFDFDHDLDDPSVVWIVEGARGFRDQKLPAVGYGEPIGR